MGALPQCRPFSTRHGSAVARRRIWHGDCRLSDIPAETVRHVQLNVWFRFRRAVEDTETILLLLERESNAKTCASLVLRLSTDASRWVPGDSQRRHSLANLLNGSQIHAEVLRSRIQPAAAIYARNNFIVHDSYASVETTFETKTTWGYPSGGLPAEVETK